jgi:hypothetical protein
VSALGFEPRTNGLKGQNPDCASYDQEPTTFTIVHWTQNKESLLDAYFKDLVNENVSSGFFYHRWKRLTRTIVLTFGRF